MTSINNILLDSTCVGVTFMKVAIVLNTSWNIFNFRLGLIKALISNGNKVIAIAPRDNYSDKLVATGCEFHDLVMDSKGLNPYRDMRLVFELRTIYKKTQPDVILHYTIKPNIYGTIAAGLLGIPSINNVSGLGTVFLWNRPIKLLATAMYKIAFSFTDFVFFQNKEDKKLFEQLVRLEENKVGLLPGSGINIEAFKPLDHKRQQPFKFLMIARLIMDKGVHEYIKAAEILKKQKVDASFQLLGATDFEHKRGIPKEEVDRWIEEGFIDYLGVTDDVSEIISGSDAVVLPSYREGTPKTLLEGGAMEKPLVTTDVPGCNNVVQDGFNGFLCKVKDPIDLAKKMKTLYELSDDEYIKMAKNSRKVINQRFDEKIVIKKYLDKIQEIVK